MCGCEICIQAGTYQESLNNWRKQQPRYINNHANELSMVSAQQFNAENILSRYSYVVLTYKESINPCAKYATFANMCDFPEKYQFSKVVMRFKLFQQMSWCFCY